MGVLREFEGAGRMKLGVHGLDGLHMQLKGQRVVNMLYWGIYAL